jgi:hypothetical protein
VYTALLQTCFAALAGPRFAAPQQRRRRRVGVRETIKARRYFAGGPSFFHAWVLARAYR